MIAGNSDLDPARVGDTKSPPVHSVATKYWWWMNFLLLYRITLLPLESFVLFMSRSRMIMH